MHTRLMLVTNVLLALACVVMCVVAVIALRQNAKLGETLVAQLREMQPAPGPASIWAEASVRVARADGSIVPDLSATLRGQAFNDGDDHLVWGEVGADGTATFGPIRPGRYEMTVSEGGGRGLSLERRVTLYPGRSELPPVTWMDPPAVTVPVSIEVAWPEDVRGRVVALVVDLARGPVDVRTSRTWSWSTAQIAVRPDGGVTPGEELFRRCSEDAAGRVRVTPDVPFSPSIPLDASLRYHITGLRVFVELEDASGSGDILIEDVTAYPPRSEGMRASDNPRTRLGLYLGSLAPLTIDAAAAAATWRIDVTDWMIEATRAHLAGADAG